MAIFATMLSLGSYQVNTYEPSFAQEDVLVGIENVSLPSIEESIPKQTQKPSVSHSKGHKRKKKKSAYKLLGSFKLTGYCPCCDCSDGYGNHTATGTIAKEGRTIAVDSKVIPYGSEVKIEGLGTFIAEDCGGAVNGNHIDVFVSEHYKTFNKKYNRTAKVWIKRK